MYCLLYVMFLLNIEKIYLWQSFGSCKINASVYGQIFFMWMLNSRDKNRIKCSIDQIKRPDLEISFH